MDLNAFAHQAKGGKGVGGADARRACAYWEKYGNCKWGDQCDYTHVVTSSQLNTSPVHQYQPPQHKHTPLAGRGAPAMKEVEPVASVLEVRYHGPPGAPPSDNLYVKGLPMGVTDDDVRTVFSAYGTVNSLRLLFPRPPAIDVIALVRMGSVEDATEAMLQLSGAAVALGDPEAAQQSVEQAQKFQSQQSPEQPQTQQAPIQRSPAIPPAASPQGGWSGAPKGTKQTLCHYMQRYGNCTKGNLCTFAHDVSELGAPLPPLVPAVASQQTPGVLQVRYHGTTAVPVPSDNLYVKGLPLEVSEEDVRNTFAMCGGVNSVRVMRPQPGAAADCTALVRMNSQAEAEVAITMLNGAILSKPNEVFPAQGNLEHTRKAPFQPKEPNGIIECRFHGPRGGPPSDNLYVKGLPHPVTEDYVRSLFSEFGEVVSIRVLAPRPPAQDSIALVRMASVEEAATVVEMMALGAQVTTQRASPY